MTGEFNLRRRRFMGVAALTVAAAHFGVGRAALAKSTSEARIPATTPGTNTSFAAIKQIDAGVLNIGYAEAGASDAPVVILLHGWPYDIHTYVDVAPLLAKAGYRVVVPYLRGYGTTRFLSPDTPRNGQQAAIAADIVALMMRSASRRPSSPAAIGAREPPISSPHSGRSAARHWFR